MQSIWDDELFGQASITELKSICENMITLEIATQSDKVQTTEGVSVRNLSLVQQGPYNSNNTIDKTIPQYVDSGDDTLVGNSDIISGYYRMVSYIIYSKLYPSWASEISGFTDLQEFIIPTGTVTVKDVEAEAESEDVGPSNVSVTCGGAGLDGAGLESIALYDATTGIVGYFSPVSLSEGSLTAEALTANNWKSLSASSGSTYNLYACSELAPQAGDSNSIYWGDGQIRFFENFTLQEYVADNNSVYNIYDMLGNWGTGTTIQYFNFAGSGYGEEAEAEADGWGNDQYFAWAIMTLHRSNYLLYSENSN